MKRRKTVIGLRALILPEIWRSGVEGTNWGPIRNFSEKVESLSGIFLVEKVVCNSRSVRVCLRKSKKKWSFFFRILWTLSAQKPSCFWWKGREIYVRSKRKQNLIETQTAPTRSGALNRDALWRPGHTNRGRGTAPCRFAPLFCCDHTKREFFFCRTAALGNRDPVLASTKNPQSMFGVALAWRLNGKSWNGDLFQQCTEMHHVEC